MGNKSEYKRYVEVMLERNLIAPGGTIVCDNVLYNGYPYVPSHFDSQPARRGFGNDIRDFNRFVYEHPELEQVVLPIRDGVSILRRKVAKPQASLSAPTADIIELCAGGSTCKISLYGAHVLSWKPAGQEDQIFLGEMAQVGKPGVAIRGGVPICWPQFAGFENAVDTCKLKHGFVRTSANRIVERRSEDSVSLALTADDQTRKSWAKDFKFVYTVSLGSGSVRME